MKWGLIVMCYWFSECCLFFLLFYWLWIFMYNQISFLLCCWFTPEVFESKVHLTANHLYTQTYTFILFLFSSRCFHGNTFEKWIHPLWTQSFWADLMLRTIERNQGFVDQIIAHGLGKEKKKISLGSPPLQDINSLFTLCNKHYEPSNGLCCSL